MKNNRVYSCIHKFNEKENYETKQQYQNQPTNQLTS